MTIWLWLTFPIPDLTSQTVPIQTGHAFLLQASLLPSTLKVIMLILWLMTLVQFSMTVDFSFLLESPLLMRLLSQISSQPFYSGLESLCLDDLIRFQKSATEADHQTLVCGIPQTIILVFLSCVSFPCKIDTWEGKCLKGGQYKNLGKHQVDQFCKQCTFCMPMNIGKSTNPPFSTQSSPDMPFDHVMMDLTELMPFRSMWNRCKRSCDMLLWCAVITGKCNQFPDTLH